MSDPRETVWFANFDHHGNVEVREVAVAARTAKRVVLDEVLQVSGYRRSVSPDECSATRDAALLLLFHRLEKAHQITISNEQFAAAKIAKVENVLKGIRPSPK